MNQNKILTVLILIGSLCFLLAAFLLNKLKRDLLDYEPEPEPDEPEPEPEPQPKKKKQPDKPVTDDRPPEETK